MGKMLWLASLAIGLQMGTLFKNIIFILQKKNTRMNTFSKDKK